MFLVSSFEFLVSGFGFLVSGFGFRVSGFEVSGFEVSGFEVSGFEDRGQKTEDRGSGCVVLRMFQPTSSELWQLETRNLETRNSELDLTGLSPRISKVML